MPTELFGGLVGCSKWSSGKAAGKKRLEAYPLGYVEDLFEPRTKPVIIFSIRGQNAP